MEQLKETEIWKHKLKSKKNRETACLFVTGLALLWACSGVSFCVLMMINEVAGFAKYYNRSQYSKNYEIFKIFALFEKVESRQTD